MENEKHVISNCAVYNDVKRDLFLKAFSYNVNCMSMSDNDRYCFLFSNADLIRMCAETCCDILQRRFYA